VRPSDAQSRDGVRWHAVDALSGEGDAALTGSLSAGDQAQQRALASSVWTNDPEHAALLERQTHMADCLDTAEALGDVV
jgi:hypothetical protein